MLEFEYGKAVCWMYCITVDKDKYRMNKEELMKALAERGIETRSHFYPLSMQPIYIKIGIGGTRFENSNELYNTGLYLQSSGHLGLEQIRYICDTIRELKNKTGSV